jgi:hypothetical protein
MSLHSIEVKECPDTKPTVTNVLLCHMRKNNGDKNISFEILFILGIVMVQLLLEQVNRKLDGYFGVQKKMKK